MGLKLYLVLMMTLFYVLYGCVSMPPRQPENICEIFKEKSSWHLAAKKSAARWNVPLSVSMAIMYQESSFQARAKPKRKYWLGFIPGPRPSTAYGYAQALNGTWESYRQASGRFGADRDDFDDAIDFVAWYSRDALNATKLKANDARGLYLAYHEGVGGYRRGTHKNKKWLLKTASEVQARAVRYQKQYQGCQKQLDAPWWARG